MWGFCAASAAGRAQARRLITGRAVSPPAAAVQGQETGIAVGQCRTARGANGTWHRGQVRYGRRGAGGALTREVFWGGGDTAVV